MKIKRQSKNIEDRRPSKTGKAGRLISTPKQGPEMDFISGSIEAVRSKPKMAEMAKKVGYFGMEKVAKKDKADLASRKYSPGRPKRKK